MNPRRNWLMVVWRLVSHPFFANIVAACALAAALYGNHSQKVELEKQAKESARQEMRLDSLQRTMTSLQFRPVLKLDGSPTVDSLLLKIPMGSLIPGGDPSRPAPMEANYLARLRIRLKNKEQTLGRVMAITYRDTSSDQPVIRDALTDERIDYPRVKWEPLPPYFRDELQQDDTVSVFVHHEIRFLQKGHFTMHYLILYENQLGMLYDTYLWAVFENVPEEFVQEFRVHRNTLQTRLFPRSDTQVLCKITKENFHIYTQVESDRIRQKLATAAPSQ